MNKKNVIIFLSSMFLLLVFSWSAFAENKPVAPSEKDKCAVCGMFVSKFPNWVSQIVFRDGSRVFFDGPKDMMKYYRDMKKYGPTKTLDNVTALYVTDYYSLSPIKATSAWFVTGSDVPGPMGKELVPFAKESGAKEFFRDHKGRKILRLKDITPEVLKSLDE